MTEIGRIVRHAAAPFVAFAVGRGWITDGEANLIGDMLVVMTVAGVLVWSKVRENRQ